MISSATNRRRHIISLCTFLVCCCSCFSSAKDNITTGEFINDGLSYLESQDKRFQMGFFQQRNTSQQTRRYVGIWFAMDPSTVVWVANRDKPVLDTTGVFTVAEDGNFKVVNKDETVFTTATDGAQLRMLKLLDTGNAVLINVPSGRILWQSFENPTDTFLPGMMMGTNITLISWKSITDPGSGSFEFQPDPGTNRFSILNGSATYLWKSGKMSTTSFDDNQILSEVFNLLSNTTTQKRNTILTNSTIVSETYWVIEPNSRLVMGHDGKIQYFSWSDAKSQWVLEWKEPKDACSVYKACGPFGMCNQSNELSPSCSCLRGFELDNKENGCKRASAICEGRTKDTFINISMASMDDTPLPIHKSDNESECIKVCLANCDCLAYSYSSQGQGDRRDISRENAQGCWLWNSEPYNLRAKGTHNISFRVSSSTIDSQRIDPPAQNPETERKSSSRKRVLVVSIVISAMVFTLFCGIGYISYKRSVNRRSNNQNITITHINELLHRDHSIEDDMQSIDVPYFELDSIIAATNDFSEENRLGQGGFGPVYRGKLPGGQEIAVKRLSSLSGQGLQEFRNEVTLIAKLQHRNLVRLLGYCIMGEEKMLLYEYLPNKSLDLIIFDRALCASLDWDMRFNIVMGIARGLNYLHHDSRLRIIHRDLKTSNILLDEEMNPKISDFGLAKIVKGKDTEDMTNRVVGTFGYMSPEYALDGIFSIKSDVFSFGVVLLEIVSGKKNIGFYQSQKSIRLLGHAWNLWTEDRPFELLDHTLRESCNSNEVLKCITVGLLCVQGDPNDRPTMTNVVMMLGGDMANIPAPKEPAFISTRDQVNSSFSSSSKLDTQTKNMLTITEVAWR
ncbi:hypothetical protein SSX86_016569 [Deinandra increscens subsp. villosa]|uniref:Receptor-like serine/threonine-protein kinase n=1 Tax=Deinandra increscens subsp. villosa TaxID=3103831 RepID=A0AAP0CY87_9ASTR